MRSKKLLLVNLIILLILFINKVTFADNHNIYETLELIQKDIKTLEKQWNGQPGKQATQYAGVLLHWKADACGKLNGEQFDATKCESKVAKNK